ncbi:MAG: hypothetical protein MI919_29920 [Holophagales bacterium]|nr:hypothetical protein [Holophagales bacterium]
MSYLDLPRIHFGGQFQALPSTFNNAPDNYNPGRWELPAQQGKPTNQPTELIETYWSPNGTGIFDLVECKIEGVISGQSATPTSDVLCGQPVSAVYTKAPPKIVDLDPMQQNVSEIWGLTVQIGDPGGACVSGTFEPVAYDHAWVRAQGENAPQNSASGSAVYQSSLTNLRWQVETSDALQQLMQISPDRLSIRLVVNSHNNAPHEFELNEKTMQGLRKPLHGLPAVPAAVLDKLQVLKTYNGTGTIPTSSYVNLQLRLLLGEADAQKYRERILAGTQKKPYKPDAPSDFGYGKIFGSIGPAAEGEPIYAVPSRMLAPLSPPAPTPTNPAFFAPAQLDAKAGRLTVDLSNSLPVEMPGDEPSTSMLGTLSLASLSPSTGETSFLAEDIPYAGPKSIFGARGGILDLTGLAPERVKELQNEPLVLLGTDPDGNLHRLLQEDCAGISYRADQFVFRMNPGSATTRQAPHGRTATVRVYVRKFGGTEGLEDLSIRVRTLSPAEALSYTKSTLGTGPNPGTANLSIPQQTVLFRPVLPAPKTGSGPAPAEVPPTASPVDVPVIDGVATFELIADCPGNPRGWIDGQVYFVTYELASKKAWPPDPVRDPNALLSVQIYQDTQIVEPSWKNGIGEILTQYGRLYPIMTQIGLSDHETVQQNAGMIQHVLSLPMTDPLHMPVTRDLSASRRQLILDWLATGAP